MAARMQVCRGPTCVADSPCHPAGAPAKSRNSCKLSVLARRGGKRIPAHPNLAVTCQAQQQQQQPATVDDAQRSRKLGRFSAKADIRRSLLNFRYEVGHPTKLADTLQRSIACATTAAAGDAKRYYCKLSNDSAQVEVDAGTLVIQPLAVSQLREVTDLLTDVFEASEDGIGLYTRWMRGQIRQYLEHHIKAAPDAVVLVATLLSRRTGSGAAHSSTPGAGGAPQPLSSSDNGSGTGGGAGVADSRQAPARTSGAPAASQQDQQQQQQQQERQQPPHQRLDTDAGVLVGTVEMSFTDTTRTRFLTLNPPTNSAYLGNMCTAPAHRRRGYGRHLLQAAEQLTQLAGYPIIYLHLRFRDTEAAAMYERAGYAEFKRDMFLLPLVGYQRRFLMSKNMAQTSRR